MGCGLPPARDHCWIRGRSLLLIFAESFFVLAANGGETMFWFRTAFTLLPFLLLFTAGMYSVCGGGRDGGGALPRLEKRRFSGDQRTSGRHDPRAGRGGRPLPSGVSYRRLRDPVHNGEPVQGRNGKAPHVRQHNHTDVRGVPFFPHHARGRSTMLQCEAGYGECAHKRIVTCGICLWGTSPGKRPSS